MTEKTKTTKKVKQDQKAEEKLVPQKKQVTKKAKKVRVVRKTRKAQLVRWYRALPRRIVINLNYCGIAIAGIIIVFGLVIFFSGQSGSLNSLLQSNANIFYSPGYHPDVSYESMKIIITKFYLAPFILAVISGTMLILVLLYILLSALSKLGNFILNMIYSFIGADTSEEQRELTSVIILALWAGAVVVAWMNLNIPNTIYYLVGLVILLAVNQLLNFAREKYFPGPDES